MVESTKINELKGIGEKTEQLFHKIGIWTVGDLIRYFPRSYDIYEKPVCISNLEENKVQTVSGTVFGTVKTGGSPRLQITSIQLRDITGVVKAVWYRMPFLKNTMKANQTITLRGKVVRKKNDLVLEHPEIYNPSSKYDEKLDTMQPIYNLTKGLTNNAVLKAMKQAMEQLDLSKDWLFQELRIEYGLAEYNYALRGIHFPEDKDMYQTARNRFVFDEFLTFLIHIRKMKSRNEAVKNQYPMTCHKEVGRLIEELPFSLTNAQRKVWNEILANFKSETVMSRLIQGDVGSGKTIVAVLALLNTALHGHQGAMMAPTEVLAKQHYDNITSLFEKHQIPVKVVLLTGSMTMKEKRRVYDQIECGYAKIIIGTHALIQGAVNFDNLALVVTDEQHRFGVNQRKSLSEKGTIPHVLVMSATPIPRTLAIILYGDLDISVIDELPSNRLPIKNCVVDTGYRNTAYQFMKNEIKNGRQCYVICPMVEESETLDAENVIDYARTLQEILGKEIVVDFLHGKMKQSQKEEIMNRFASGASHILVSTTVIEVGIDVPNATVMLIENAERFGLAQLHQLRGRVGRGSHQSYCIFMSASKSKETRERLEILSNTNDGFKIANEDLRLRGPGDLFGIRQSGLMNFKIGDIYQDAKILAQANEAAGWIELNYPEFYENLSVSEFLNQI